MKAAVFVEPGKIEVQERPQPTIQQPTDAIIRVIRACVCGSDLWWYRGLKQREVNSTVGHEAIGIVEQVGAAVQNVQPGDFVIVPFTHGCGHCAACRAGFEGNCVNEEPGLNPGYQAQYLRFTNAHWALVKIPGQPEDYDEDQLNSLLTLSDVMATGYHAAMSAQVQAGDTVAIVGDGAVGLCAVIAAKLQGAQRIITLSHHTKRAQLAQKFGATDIVSTRDEAAIQAVLKLTDQAGVDAVLECVGTEQAVSMAVKIARAGAVIGRVGLPQNSQMNTNDLFWGNIGLRGGIASVTKYDRQRLLAAVLKREINPGQVFTHKFTLDQIQAAYEAMDQRQAIKSLVIVNQ